MALSSTRVIQLVMRTHLHFLQNYVVLKIDCTYKMVDHYCSESEYVVVKSLILTGCLATTERQVIHRGHTLKINL